MSKSISLEPGLLAVFRLLAGLRLGLLVLAIIGRIIWLSRGNPQLVPYSYGDYFAIFDLAEASLLLVFLWWSPLQRRLGRWFLPLALLLATVGPVLGHYFALSYSPPDRLTEARALLGSWQLIPVLFVPLILIGWQYDFRRVVFYCAGTALGDLALKIMALGWGSPLLLAPAGAIFMRTVAYVVAGYMVVRLMTIQRRQRQALVQANGQLANYAATLEQLTVSHERNRLARELHDTLAHTLSAMTVQLEAIKVSVEGNSGQAETLVDHALTTTRTGLAETRRALQALRASPLEDLGLALALRHLAETLVARAGARLTWQGPAAVLNVPAAVEQCIYRIAQESLENVVRHAMARQVSVQLAQNNGTVDLTITDDGRGFEVSQVDLDQHFGLRGMQERADMVGGRLAVNSHSEQGTTIHFSVEVTQ
jgi:signal transduction histidine kinase